MLLVLIACITLFYFSNRPESVTEAISNQFPPSTSDLISATLTPQLVTNDTNWAGYIAASDLLNPEPTVTNVSASWTVPTVVISINDTFSAVWIDIGGY